MIKLGSFFWIRSCGLYQLSALDGKVGLTCVQPLSSSTESDRGCYLHGSCINTGDTGSDPLTGRATITEAQLAQMMNGHKYTPAKLRFKLTISGAIP